MTVENDTGVSLEVVTRDGGRHSAGPLEAGERGEFMIREVGECAERAVYVVDPEARLVSRLDPPVCHEQVWVVQQEDLRVPDDWEITECLGEDLMGTGVPTPPPGERSFDREPCHELNGP